MHHNQIVSFLWSIADLIRDSFRRGHYQDVILPLTVLRRLDCVLEPTKTKVLGVNGRFREHRTALISAAVTAKIDVRGETA